MAVVDLAGLQSMAESAFRRVQQEYFPHWRTAAEWNLVVGYIHPDKRPYGLCDRSGRTIYVSPRRAEAGGSVLLRTIVH